jgi:hypothetical protein
LEGGGFLLLEGPWDLPTETNTAQPFTRRKVKTIGQASEASTAQTVKPQRRYVQAQANETDTAGTLTPAHRTALAQASEADTASTFSWTKVKGIGLGEETDTAQALTVQKVLTLGLANEADTAGLLVPINVMNIATEADTAFPMTVVGGSQGTPLLQVEDPQEALNFFVRKIHALNQAEETDSPGAFLPQRSVALAQASEVDVAFDVIQRFPITVTLSMATEVDAARVIVPSSGLAILDVESAEIVRLWEAHIEA